MGEVAPGAWRPWLVSQKPDQDLAAAAAGGRAFCELLHVRPPFRPRPGGWCPASGTEEMWVTMYQIAGSLLALHQLLEAHGAHVGLCLQNECTRCSCAAASPGE